MTNKNLILVVLVNLVITQNVYAKKSQDFLTPAVNLTIAGLKVERIEMPPPRGSNFKFTEIRLKSEATGPFRLFEKAPKSATPLKLTTVVMMSGLGASRDAIYLLPDAPNIRVISYQYPFDEMDLKHLDAEDAGKALLRLPAQILASYLWLLGQSLEVDPLRIFSLNVSLGSFIAPAPLRLLREIGFSPAGTIFAFGGADLYPFLSDRPLPYINDPVRSAKIMSDIKEAMTKHLNPRRNLARLKGPFLVINGTDDEMIPFESSQSLIDKLSGPKEVEELKTGHISRDKPQIIQQTFARVLNWINAQQATIPQTR